LDTLRFLTSELDETNFESRCFDNLEISVPSAVEGQGMTGGITVALSSVWSAFQSVWGWLGGQLSTIRQVFTPNVVIAATLEDPAFRSYFFHNGARVAMRVEGDPTADGLYYFLHDQLSSTTVTLKRNGDGTLTKVSELRYTPWGKLRDSGYDASLTPTDYRFTDQRMDSYINLYWYDSRWYDPYLNLFAPFVSSR
jgi:hypothetical protein